jgi:superfamily I DNA/RNA helicase
LGYKSNFVIYSEAEQLGAIKKILANINTKAEKVDPGAVLAMLSRFKNGGKRSDAVLRDPNTAAFAAHIQSRYESALRACNAVDFDDLILLTLKLFKEHPDALAACRNKYRYVMVDEYQDTNAAQFKLVHALTSEHQNFCVVGDDDQSIYGWRGAEIANLLNLEQYYPKVKVIKLEQNYRSTNTILSAANAVIKNNMMRRGKQLWSQKGNGEKILLCTYPDDEAEARSTAEQIEFARISRNIPWGDQAILFRTNQQARPMETELRKAGIRYHLIGSQSYFDRREVKDFLAYVKMFVNPDDDISLLRIANVPARGLSDVTMERLIAASHERKCSVFKAMRHTDVLESFVPRTRESIQAFTRLIEENRAKIFSEKGLSLEQWADSFLNEIGYIADLRKSEKNPDIGDARVRSLKEIVTTLDEGEGFTANASERLNTFLEELTLDSDRTEDKDVPKDCVTLITMHSCKGLEFPHVHVVGLEDGLLPHTRSKEEGTMDEERRLFYVAITRAMVTLTLSHCVARRKYGQPLPCHPSRFLKELPMELVDSQDEKSKNPVNVSTGKSLFDAMRAALE